MIQEKVSRMKNKVEPPYEQFLSTQPIFQQILQNDCLAKMVNQEIKPSGHDNYMMDKSKANVVKSFDHQKSASYFDIELSEQSLENVNGKKERSGKLDNRFYVESGGIAVRAGRNKYK